MGWCEAVRMYVIDNAGAFQEADAAIVLTAGIVVLLEVNQIGYKQFPCSPELLHTAHSPQTGLSAQTTA